MSLWPYKLMPGENCWCECPGVSITVNYKTDSLWLMIAGAEAILLVLQYSWDGFLDVELLALWYFISHLGVIEVIRTGDNRKCAVMWWTWYIKLRTFLPSKWRVGIIGGPHFSIRNIHPVIIINSMIREFPPPLKGTPERLSHRTGGVCPTYGVWTNFLRSYAYWPY